jgi:mutator protein MutT
MTMRGYRVERKRGRDCHGIPAENFVNKQLGITSKKQVEAEYGVGPYVEACRTMVNNVNDNRRRFVEYIGRWVDMDNAYFTMDNDFIESVLWVFSDLYHKNLIYKGFKVLGYSWALGTALSSSEIAEWYEDRQDPAVTVKFKIHSLSKSAEETNWFAHSTDWKKLFVRAIIKNEQWQILHVYQKKWDSWAMPWWWVDVGETPDQALIREVKEEVWCDVIWYELLWTYSTIFVWDIRLWYYYNVSIQGTPSIMEPNNHNDLTWITVEHSDNDFTFALKLHNLVIDDEHEIRQKFHHMFVYKQLLQNYLPKGDHNVYFLARTTTPRTLPSNMFLAVNSKLTYVQIYDHEAAEYYILAKNLLTKYYKDPATYTIIYQMKGSELVGLRYHPLFEYIQTANTNEHNEYLEKYFQVLDAEFVTDESGTGIAHEAPAFGEDDYNLVAGFLGRDRAHEWLFNPVDDNGEFTDAVTERAGDECDRCK